MVLPTLLRTANANPHYLPLFFMLIFLSSSIKTRDCKRSLPRFEVMNTQAFGEVNSRKTEDLSGLRQSPLLSDTAVSSMHLARGTQFSALSYFSLVCSSPWRETFSSVQSLSCVHSLQPHGLQHAKLSCPSPTPRAYSNSIKSIKSVMPSNHLILYHPLLLLPSIFPASASFPWVSASHQGAEVLELQHQSFQWIFWVDFL